MRRISLQHFFLYTALGISAAAALIYEVVATNILLYFFVESSYSLSTVLGVFLLGLAFGSLMYYRLQGRVRDRYLLFGVLQFLIALYGFFILARIADIAPALHTFGLFTVSSLILLVPTISLGIIFPLTISLVGDERESGLVYFVDLVGAVLGSFVAGFYLIPVLGNTAAIYTAAFGGLGAAFLVFKTRGRLATAALAALFVFLIPLSSPVSALRINEVSFNKPSPYGEVVIRNQILYIDGRSQCSWVHGEEATERQIVRRVFENIRRPDARILNIGLGCGLSLEEILKHTESPVDLVEINPVVVEANRLETSLLENMRINLIIDEGVNYLRESTVRYDSVIIDIENPAVIHSSDLYTVESFREVHDALAPGGVFGLWVNRCRSGEYSDIIRNTLARAFQEVYQLGDNIFIASDRPLGYTAYIPFTDSRDVNTLDRKPLSKIFFEECRFGEGSEHYLESLP